MEHKNKREWTVFFVVLNNVLIGLKITISIYRFLKSFVRNSNIGKKCIGIKNIENLFPVKKNLNITKEFTLQMQTKDM